MDIIKASTVQSLPEAKKSSNTKPAAKKLKAGKNNVQLMPASSTIEELTSALLLHLTQFIQPGDLFRLSMTSKCMQSNIDNSIWNAMIQRLCACTAEFLRPRTPRLRVLGELIESNTCKGCHGYFLKGLTTLRCKTRYFGLKVCQKCYYYNPKFQEISYKEAMSKYGLTRKRLMALENRTISVSRGRSYSRLFNLQDVIDEAA